MVDAYKAGIPANGKPVPDGAKMAKIHYVPKVREEIPGQPTVPGTLHDIDFMVKDSKRFADSGGWGYGAFEYDAASDIVQARRTRTTRRHRHMTPSAASHAIRSCRQMTTFSRSIRNGEGAAFVASLWVWRLKDWPASSKPSRLRTGFREIA